jgi:hypothetical protein
MNPNSDSAWWIVSYTIALVGESDDPPREPARKVLRNALMVRCEHWREAFNKGRRLALDEVSGLNSVGLIRYEQDGCAWQFMGINQLVPMPNTPREGDVLGSIDCTYQSKPLYDLFRETVEDYQMKNSFDDSAVEF